MHLRKTKTSKGRIYLAIVDSYYDKQRKMSRSKTVESLGYLDELENYMRILLLIFKNVLMN